MNLWMCLGGNLLNGNSIIEVPFLYLMRDITSDCALSSLYALSSSLWNPESYRFLCVLRHKMPAVVHFMSTILGKYSYMEEKSYL